MKILLTNDDGIYAEGIQTLAKVLNKRDHKIVMVAPDRERSASAHSITINDPLRAKEVEFENLPNMKSFKVDGTPADCVKLGIEKFIDFEPDLIISGINNGGNLGYDVLYSGTVSAAIEAWMMGYNSIAVSLVVDQLKNFDLAATFIDDFLDKIELELLPERMLLNVNVPDIIDDELDGPYIADLGSSNYVDTFEKRVDPMGENYYWLSGRINDEFSYNTDIWAINHNKVALTPLKIELTNVSQKEVIQKILKS